MYNFSMLKIQNLFEIGKFLCVPKAQMTYSFLSEQVDGGTNLATHGLPNSRLKPRIE